jgi:DNA-binding NtrC family response regulator
MMTRVLVIDQDRDSLQRLGLACLDRGIGAALADNVCDGVRILLNDSISLIVVGADALRLTAHEQFTLFERVAPGIPVVVSMAPAASLERRVAFELAGFAVVTAPPTVDELLKRVSRSA